MSATRRTVGAVAAAGGALGAPRRRAYKSFRGMGCQKCPPDGCCETHVAAALGDIGASSPRPTHWVLGLLPYSRAHAKTYLVLGQDTLDILRNNCIFERKNELS